MRVNVIEGARYACSCRHAWHSTAGTIPSTRLRLSVRRAQLTQFVSHIRRSLIHSSYYVLSVSVRIGDCRYLFEE